MPELPEVETITRQLSTVLPGKIITSLDILRPASLQGQSLKVIHNQIQSISRRQKIIIIALSNPQSLIPKAHLLIHLKMTGQLIFIPGTKDQALGTRIVGGHPTADWIGELPSKHTRLIFEFDDQSRLFFNDQRTFGWIKILAASQYQSFFSHFPPDVVDASFTHSYFHQLLAKSNRAIKLVILDQALMGGMGNIYANDALFLSRIHPARPAKSLSQTDSHRLYHAMLSVINTGIETGGASYSNFVGIDGLGGHYQDHFLVYGKTSLPCPNCGNILQKLKIGGRGSIYCSTCQT